jgi:hypothetical protein
MGSQPDEHDKKACENVDDEMIRGEDDRRCHRGGPDHSQHARGEVPGGAPDRDAHEQVPAEVQAGESRVLVGEPRRLERPVRVRVERDGVDERGIGKPRGRDRKEREEERKPIPPEIRIALRRRR